ncbi:heparinase II/III family protein [archaeon]|nr:heparinase II/III family protein [archaeon]
MRDRLKFVKKREILVVLLVVVLAFVVLSKYYPLEEYLDNGVESVSRKIGYSFGKCSDGEIRINLPDESYLCRLPVDDKSVYLEIYDTYPKYGNGKESIYDYLSEGKVELADKYVDDVYDFERYPEVELKDISWEEDPYDEKYWRFIFYSLRFTRHLVYAQEKLDDEQYNEKLSMIIENFIDEGMDNPKSWEDYHSVAFRSMALTNAWWKLREENMLSEELSTKILKAIEIHGDFLLDETHYEPFHNHGMNEAAALLLLAINFPELNSEGSWMEVSTERVDKGLEEIIDEDGVLIENSPYYHFYSLEKYWQIYQYSEDNNIFISEDFGEKLKNMIIYGTYILQPNMDIPMLGASLKRTINLNKNYIDIAEEDEEFLYVLTKGQEGTAPKNTTISFESSGQTIMRSGWKKGSEFEKQTQLIFDAGPYRTEHSDLDALNFNLYGDGLNLITDSGLYTYEKGLMRDYFHGTSAHNTVIVDDEDQIKGTPTVSNIVMGEGYVYQTAHSNLYVGVDHYRTIGLLGEDLVLIVDKLQSDESHEYKQIFHLFPEAEININDLNINAILDGEDKLGIYQLNTNGINLINTINQTSPPGGICSYEYEKITPCHSIAYSKKDNNALYVTILRIGNQDDSFSANFDNESYTLEITNKNTHYSIIIDNLEKTKIKSIENSIVEKPFNLILNNSKWEIIIDGEASKDYVVKEKNEKLIIVNEKFPKYNKIEINIDDLRKYFTTDGVITTEIPYEYNSDEFKIYEQEDFIPIFGYHRVIPDLQEIKNKGTEIHQSKFREQVEYATNVMECNWITMSELVDYLVNQEKIPRDACVMNFDDSTIYEYDYALPILEEYNVKATFYAIVGEIGEKRYRMNWKQLDYLHKSGHDIQSHTYNTTKGINSENLSEEDIYFQLYESKKILENRYDTSINSFAYPLGEWNIKTIQILENLNYLTGRDTSKDYSWREKRSSAVWIDGISINTDGSSGNNNTGINNVGIWHMFYYKPETKTFSEINNDVGYNSWWQFEENYRIDKDKREEVRTLSSIKPTNISYGVLSLENSGDKVSTNFITSQDSKYIITILASINEKSSSSSTREMVVRLDSEKMNIELNRSSCIDVDKYVFCEYTFEHELNKGVHDMSVENLDESIKLDKFNIHREISPNVEYTGTIIETIYEKPKDGELKSLIVSLEAENENIFTRIYRFIIGLFD